MDNSNGSARSSRERPDDSRVPSRAASELFGGAGNSSRIPARRGSRGRHSHASPSTASSSVTPPSSDATPPLADTAPLTADSADWPVGVPGQGVDDLDVVSKGADDLHGPQSADDLHGGNSGGNVEPGERIELGGDGSSFDFRPSADDRQDTAVMGLGTGRRRLADSPPAGGSHTPTAVERGLGSVSASFVGSLPENDGSADILENSSDTTGNSTGPGDKASAPRKKSLVKRLAKVCIAIVVTGALVFTGLNVYMTTSTDDSVVTVNSVPSEAKADCILILGASVRANRKPSPMLLKRLERGLELYRKKAAPKVLVSGDNATVAYNEVKVMREWLQAKGVPPQDIFEDHAGFSTYESMYRARDVFKVKRMIVVTQRYHLARAIYTGDALGLKVWGVAANGNNYSGQIKRDMREWVARVKDLGKTVYKPEPRFLGPALPISGDGRATMG